MTQTVPATCVLGPGKTGLTIGLRVLNLDGTTYAAFATTGVAETSVAGTYRKAGGVVVPATGGYIVWGEAATDYAEATVESTSVNVTHHAGVAVAAADADGMIKVNAEKWTGLSLDEFAPPVTAFMDSGNTITSQRIRDAMKLAPTAGDPAAGSVDAHLDAVALEATAQAVLAVIGAGSGTGLYTDTITNGSAPLDGVRVQLSTDEAGEHRVYETFTNALGVFVLRPDPGTYYRWLDLAGITFEQGVEVEVAAL